MNKSELIQHLYDEISRQNTFYMAMIGILVTLLIGFTGLLGYFQWRLSTKQIGALKDNIEKELNKKYSFDRIPKIGIMDTQNQITIGYLFQRLSKDIQQSSKLDPEFSNLAFNLVNLLIAVPIDSESKTSLNGALDTLGVFISKSKLLIRVNTPVDNMTLQGFSGWLDFMLKEIGSLKLVKYIDDKDKSRFDHYDSEIRSLKTAVESKIK